MPQRVPVPPVARRVFVAFAGGGAKGLIHVGALKALEDRNVTFKGLAGTSAGAIIAALKAAGFTSSDLLDAHTGSTLLGRLHTIDPSIKKATDIFGPGGWWRVAAFRTLSERAKLAFIIAAIVAVTTPIILVVAGETRSVLVISLAAAFCAVLGAGLILIARLLLGGLADVRRCRDALGKLLQTKMFPGETDRVVRMSDFGVEGRPTLKIVSANLSRRSLQLFSPERTPEVAVADAVAASICLPVIFAPWRIAGAAYVDGGIVSNLPAWPFDEERELDPEALTIAIEIADTTNAPVVKRFNWLPSAIRTALFGSGELNLRVSGEAEQVVLESSLKLLQFDLTPEKARQEVIDGEAAASVRLDKRLFRRPELYRNACQVTQGVAEDVIETALGIRSKRIRVAIGVPDRDYRHSLRLRFSAGYERDTDEGLLIPIEGSVLGAAWKSGESLFELAPFPAGLDLPGDANRLRRKLVWPKLAWQLCIPISDATGRPRLMVQIDGDARLPQDAILADAVTEIENSVIEFFGLIMHELSELEDDHGMEECDLQEAQRAG